MCSLFDSDPDVIGDMAFLLDKKKAGLKNWSHLASKLGIARSDFTSFATCHAGNPTEGLFDLLIVYFPESTVGELINHLKVMRRADVVKAIKESKEGECLFKWYVIIIETGLF